MVSKADVTVFPTSLRESMFESACVANPLALRNCKFAKAIFTWTRSGLANVARFVLPGTDWPDDWDRMRIGDKKASGTPICELDLEEWDSRAIFRLHWRRKVASTFQADFTNDIVTVIVDDSDSKIICIHKSYSQPNKKWRNNEDYYTHNNYFAKLLTC